MLSLRARGAEPATRHAPLQRLSGALSHSDKVWNSHKRHSHYDEQQSGGLLTEDDLSLGDPQNPISQHTKGLA